MIFGMDGLCSFQGIREKFHKNSTGKFSLTHLDSKATWNEGIVKNKGMEV